MTISAKYIGQSTVQISTQFTPTSGAANLTSFMTFANAVADAITDTPVGQAGALSGVVFTAASGVTPQVDSLWTLFDSFWGGQDNSAGNASPIYTQVFRCINKDGVTYKNAVLRYNLKRLTVNITCVEYWDTPANYAAASPAAITSHTGVNEAFTYFDSAPIGFNLTSCDFIVNFAPRWGLIHSYINNEPSMWAGIFENAREDIMDTVISNYPCFSWISSTLWCLGAGTAGGASKPLATGDYTLICMPRTRQGYMGAAAAKTWAGDYGAAFVPNWLNTTTNPFIWYLGNGATKFVSNGWDSTRRLTLPIKPVSDYAGTITNYGQLFGIKVLAPIGQNMNKITIPCDSDGNASGTGTDRAHWLLNNHHKTYSTDNTAWFANTGWAFENLAFGGRPEAICYTGVSIYAILSGGTSVVRFRLDTKTVSTIVSAGSYTDIEFDGERYVYVTSSATTGSLTRIDTADDATIVTTNSVGFQSLAVNGNTVVCSPSTSSTTPTLYRYVAQASTGTVNPITTASPATVLLGTALPETMIFRDLKSDFEGNIWCNGLVTIAANHRLLKLPYNGSAIVINAATATAGIPVNVGLQFLDGNNAISWQAVSGGAIYQSQFNPRTGLLIGSVQTVSTASALTTNGVITAFKFQGTIMMIPRNSAVANNWFINSLAKNTGNFTVLGAPVVNIDQGTTNTFATANNLAFYDGSRIYVSLDTGLRVYSNVNGGLAVGGNPTGTVTLGQVAIPA